MANDLVEQRKQANIAKQKIKAEQAKANRGRKLSPKERQEQELEADAAGRLVRRGWLLAR